MVNDSHKAILDANTNLRIGLIGCGAVVNELYLPALQKIGIKSVVAIDNNLESAIHFASHFENGQYGKNIDDLIPNFDAAIIATPSALHFDHIKKLIAANKPILVEKPVCTTYKDVQILNEEAKNAVVQVGMIRRYWSASRLCKDIISNETLGRPLSFDFEDGFNFNWPVRSMSFYNKNVSGGGVTMDTGAHVLDTLCWWLGEYAEAEYFDDSKGGIEANADLNIVMQSGATGTVKLSRTRLLRNSFVIKFEQGELEYFVYSNEVEIRPKRALSLCKQKHDLNISNQNINDIFIEQINKWINVITKKCYPEISISEVAESIRLIDYCYCNKKSIHYPWE